MSNFGSFTAKFTGPTSIPDFEAVSVSVAPNAPPKPTSGIQAHDTNNGTGRYVLLSFQKNLPDGDHTVTGSTIVVVSTPSFGYSTLESSVDISIDSVAGTYSGTFEAQMRDPQQRDVTVKGEFNIKVVPT